MKAAIVAFALLGTTACKVRDFLYCEDDSYCTHYTGKTYCDVEGKYPDSEGIGKTCIVPPFDAMPMIDAIDLPDGPPDMALLRMTPDTWMFPAIDRGAVGSIEMFIVENRGGLISGPVAVTLTGPDQGSFTILSGETTDCAGMQVPGNQSCFVRVQFTPTGAGGAKTATLDVQAGPGGEQMSSLSSEVHDCQPSTTMCDAGKNSVIACDDHGAITEQKQCGAMGCDSVNTVCLDVDPSNGLAAALDTTATASALDQPTGTLTIDTDAGTMKDANNTLIASSTTLVTQTGFPSIRVFAFSSVNIGNATVVGSKSLAIVSNGAITLTGDFDASAVRGRNKPGPGSLSGTACEGVSSTGGAAGGGGGRESAGGKGGGTNGKAGGQAYQTRSVEPLVGGCNGGNVVLSGTLEAGGGYGGGAVQLVSRVSISLTGAAVIDVGGEGGASDNHSFVTASGAGGGTGGAILLEAPTIDVNGANVVIGARGGSGGAGGATQPGTDGVATIDGVAKNACGASAACGGDGGFASWTGSGSPSVIPPKGGTDGGGLTGGGGGSTGYAYFRTKTSSISIQAGAVIRAFGGAGMLRTRPAP
jgi:hypothetical protein